MCSTHCVKTDLSKRASSTLAFVDALPLLMEWTTIESDPGVFTEIVSAIGVRGVAFEELYTLEADELKRLEPIYGLIFLFKYRGDDGGEVCAIDAEAESKGVFFARQMIQNACATQAVLSVLLNADDKLELGETLSAFKEFTSEFDAETKGLAISNSDVIRDAHNSFARPEPIVLQSRPAREDDDVFHFVGYVPKGKVVYELDGLRQGPINHGHFGNEDDDKTWLDVAVPAIQRRIAAYSTNEIKFNLLAVTKDQRISLRERIAELQGIGNSIDDSLAEEITQLSSELAYLESKAEDWRNENIRRRWNYLPFIFGLLREVAAKKQLMSAFEIAKNNSEKGASDGQTH